MLLVTFDLHFTNPSYRNLAGNTFEGTLPSTPPVTTYLTTMDLSCIKYYKFVNGVKASQDIPTWCSSMGTKCACGMYFF